MTGTAFVAGEEALTAALAAVLPPGILAGCRAILAGDEAALWPAEAESIRSRSPQAQRASGSARMVARGLLHRLGREQGPILRGASGAPAWPAGVTGSLAHDEEMAVAAVALQGAFRSIGIDVEPAEPLPDDIAVIAVHPGDVVGGEHRGLGARLVYCAKEAAYKAVYPLDGEVLGYEAISVHLPAMVAVTPRRTVRLMACLEPRIVVLATA